MDRAVPLVLYIAPAAGFGDVVAGADLRLVYSGVSRHLRRGICL